MMNLSVFFINEQFINFTVDNLAYTIIPLANKLKSGFFICNILFYIVILLIVIVDVSFDSIKIAL